MPYTTTVINDFSMGDRVRVNLTFKGDGLKDETRDLYGPTLIDVQRQRDELIAHLNASVDLVAGQPLPDTPVPVVMPPDPVQLAQQVFAELAGYVSQGILTADDPLVTAAKDQLQAALQPRLSTLGDTLGVKIVPVPEPPIVVTPS